jgi:hypothetical protein
MQMEIACLGRPLAIYRLPQSMSFGEGAVAVLLERLFSASPLHRMMRTVAKIGSRLGFGHHRDISNIHHQLVQDGLAVWFGEPFRLDGRRPKDELPEVTARIVGLL